MDSAWAEQLGRSTREALLLYQEVKKLAYDSTASLTLPEIVAIGKQSSGKSSVLTRLLAGGVSFPTKHGTCTRCVITVYSRRTDSERKCKFSLKYLSDDKQKPIKEIVKSEDEVIGADDWNNIPDKIQKLQTKLLKGLNEKQNFEFTANEIVVEIEGTDFPDIVIKDMPGLISNGNAKDIEAVKKVTQDSIKRPNAIIMVCVPCEDDIDNQEALRLARKYDPDGERTLGVLTKPDRIQKSTEGEYITILKNQHPKAELAYGWYTLRCPSPDELKVSHFSNSDAVETETRFFDSDEIGMCMKSAMGDRCGTENLLARVSSKIADDVRTQVPNLLPDMQRLCENTENEVTNSKWGVDETNVRGYIEQNIKMLSEKASQQILCRGTGRRSLWQSVREEFEKLKDALAKATPQMTKTPADKATWTLAKINEALQSYRGRELFPRTDIASAIHHVVQESIDLWEPRVISAVQNVKQHVEAFFVELIDGLQVSTHFACVLKDHVRTLVEQRTHEAEEQLKRILSRHGCGGMEQRFLTVNEDQLAQLRNTYLRKVVSRGERWFVVPLRAAVLAVMFCVVVTILMPLLALMRPISFLEWVSDFRSGPVVGKVQVFVFFLIFAMMLLLLYVYSIAKTHQLWDDIGIKIGAKPSLELEVMASAMAYYELSYRSCADEAAKTIDSHLLHSFAHDLDSSLREILCTSQYPGALLKSVFNAEDLLERENLRRRLEQEKITLKAVKDYVASDSKLAEPKE